MYFLQGLGLYAARDIEKHTMVIEYIGTIIRNEVANRKEKLYESQVWLVLGRCSFPLSNVCTTQQMLFCYLNSGPLICFRPCYKCNRLEI